MRRDRPEPDAESRLAIAAMIAGRAALFGFGIALIVPPVTMEDVLRALGGCAGPMMLWWFFGGPGPRQRWLLAVACGMLNLVAALMFARFLVGFS